MNTLPAKHVLEYCKVDFILNKNGKLALLLSHIILDSF